MNEREYIEDLVKHAEDTVSFLSNERKQERERSVCAALLRCLGIDFYTEEIVSSTDEPPDVVFREARFEVLLMLDEGRRLHEDWKSEAERRRSAGSSDNLWENWTTPGPLSYGVVISLVTKALNKKAEHYSKNVGANLDALIYLNLKGKYLDTDSPLPNLDPLRSQGWRSVSILMPQYGRVLYAEPSAPSFLRNLVGRTMAEWSSPLGLFDL